MSQEERDGPAGSTSSRDRTRLPAGFLLRMVHARILAGKSRLCGKAATGTYEQRAAEVWASAEGRSGLPRPGEIPNVPC